jgi:hypothetical protein
MGRTQGEEAAEIARLATLGLSHREIAQQLGIPEERIVRTARGAADAAPRDEDLSDQDKTLADTHPASDPPPGPLA